MKYRYKFKGKTENQGTKEVKSSLDKKKKMLLLLIWSTIAIGLYLFFSQRFVMTTVQVCEVLVFFGLVAYFINIFRIVNATKNDSENTARRVKLENIGKYILIFVLPLIFIILFDFLISSFKMFGR